MVVIGLILLLAAVIVGIIGVATNAGPSHPDGYFAVLGYHVTGSTGTLFLVGIVVGAVGVLGLFVMLGGARRAAGRARSARRDRKGARREAVPVSQGVADNQAAPVNSDAPVTLRRRFGLLGRRSTSHEATATVDSSR
jgi:hypothetical protein